MARKKDEDIFKKLRKEKPLVKRSDIQPLSSRDFSSRKSILDLNPEEKADRKRDSARGYAAAPKRAVYKSPPRRQGADLASRYNQRQASPQKKSLSIFGEEDAAVNQTAAAKRSFAAPVHSSRKDERPARQKAVPSREIDDMPKTSLRDNTRPKEPSETMHVSLQADAYARKTKTETSQSVTPRRGANNIKPKQTRAEDAGLDIFAENIADPNSGNKDIRPRLRGREEDGSLNLFPSVHAAYSAPEQRDTFGEEVESRTLDRQEIETSQEADPGVSHQFRHEMKYYINYRDYVLLKNTLKPLLALDRNAGGDGDYHIRSLYFDDVYETALMDKMSGSDNRSKYRIRIYNYSDGVIKFEKKIKQGQYIAKSSIRLSRDECDALIAGECGFLANRAEPLASEIYLQMKNNVLRPRVIVDYRREAYVSPFENVRITFDKDLKAGLWLTDIFNSNAPTMPMLESGIMVLEVKFNKYLPVYIKAVLNNVDAAQRSAISKYVLCRKFD